MWNLFWYTINIIDFYICRCGEFITIPTLKGIFSIYIELKASKWDIYLIGMRGMRQISRTTLNFTFSLSSGLCYLNKRDPH